jgi:hypothetical protein
MGSRCKYATWNVKRARRKEELDKTAKENNIKISVITESKRTLHSTKRD